MHSFYKKFIEPLSKETDQAEREIVLNYLLVGIFALAAVTLLDTIVTFLVSREHFLLDRIVSMSVNILFIVLLYGLARYKKQYKFVAFTLTLLIALFGAFVGYRWGVLNPNSLILFGLAVVMAGILISARSSIYTAGCIALVMAGLQYGEVNGYTHPSLSWVSTKPTEADVIGFAAILFVIAFVSWLFNRQMELSLRRAWRSEKALKRQKMLLEIKVEKRAQELEAAQLEKMQELYRFAELGRLSTALFHDLANHLSTVSLDIEGLSEKGQSDIMRRISQNVGHIDTIVQRVRQQIRGKNNVEVFNVLDETSEVVKILAAAAEQANVEIQLQTDKSVKASLSYKGDPIRFRQIILNLISNGIEAYPRSHSKSAQPRIVAVQLARQHSTLVIEVTDYGLGIKAGDQQKIFRPFYTTKDKGVGIGLFIVRQVVENDFKGSLDLKNSNKQGTTFSVSLPKSYYAKRSRA